MTAPAQTERTFGVEIECVLPEGVTRGNVATRLRRAGLLANAVGYTHEEMSAWKLTTDGSVADGGTRSCEVVSPVLAGEAGIADVVKVAAVLQAAGCIVNKQCGVHVHVYAGDYDLPQMKKLAINFVHSETAFDAIVPPSRRKDENQFIQSNRTGFGGSYENEGINKAIAAFEACTTMSDLIYKVSNVTPRSYSGELTTRNWRDNGRYRKLNLLPMLRFKTVEFRQHAGTVEGEKIANWIRLCVAFVDRSKVSRPRPRTSATPHVDSAELGMLLTWLRMPPAANAYFRARRKEFSQRNVERAAERARQAALAEAQARQAAWEADAPARALRLAEQQAAEARRIEENNRLQAMREAAAEQSAREAAEQRRIRQAAYYSERRAAAEAALAAARDSAPAAVVARAAELPSMTALDEDIAF